MPFFNEASRIYNPIEVNFMRSCFSHAAIMLEESDQDYSATDLASLSCFTRAASGITLISASYRQDWLTNGSKDATQSNHVPLPTTMAQREWLWRNPLNTIHSPKREQKIEGRVSHEAD